MHVSFLYINLSVLQRFVLFFYGWQWISGKAVQYKSSLQKQRSMNLTKI